MEKKTLSIADLLKDKWTQAVTLSITILAVCAAISSLKASGFSTKVALYTTLESKGWSYFQSKSIKQHVCESELRLYQYYRVAGGSQAGQQLASERMSFLEKEVARYDLEKAKIKQETEALAKKQEIFKQQSASLALATMLLQISIMLSSVSTLTQKRFLWGLGLCFGVLGLAYMIHGLFLL